ncbi:MAG TPA: CHAP domain-containing protein [Patescibacteria group bacterium]|nr:CHAP domain-containing protein [Patescibacteria group bacterium]
MKNNILSQLLDLPVPETLSDEQLKFLSDRLKNILEYESEEFKIIKKQLINLGIPKDIDIPDKYLGILVEHWYEERIRTTKEAERPEAQQKTTINKDESAVLEEKLEKREEQIKETRENAKQEVDRARQKLEELKTKNDQILKDLEKQKEKVLHVKIEPQEETKLTEDEQKDFDTYKEFSKQDPKQAVEDLSQEIEKRTSVELKKQGLTEEEIKVVTKQTATQLVENLTQIDSPQYIPTSYQTAVLAHIANTPDVISKTAVTKDAQDLIKHSANNVAVFRIFPDQIAKDITKLAFGESFANIVFGVGPDKVKVSISETPQPGYVSTFSPYQVVQSNQQIIDDQSQSLALVKEFGVDQTKGVLYRRAGTLIEKRIALLTPQSAAGKILQSTEAKSLLFSRFGIGTPVKWEATNLLGRLALKIAPEYAPIISGVGKLAGINTGITSSVAVTPSVAISTGVTKQVAGKVATSVGVKAGLSGLLAKGAAAIGVGLGVFTAGVSILITAVMAAIGKIINLPKIKKWLRDNGPILLGVGGLAIWGPWVGGGMFLGGMLLAKNFSLAKIGASVGGFLGVLGRAFVFTIAAPVIIALVVIPPMVAFIMLVINSGAYMVPPQPVVDGPGPGPGLGCSPLKEPTGINYSVNSAVATRGLHIVEDLYQGFWCYWNRSPGDYSTDVTTYPPSYPELFDEQLYATNPDASPTAGEDLFWCTWLIQKAYTENGISINPTLYSPTMKDDFYNNHTYFDAKDVNSTNALPGAVIFFDVDNEKDRIDHVGMIYQVNGDDVTYIQSNAGLKVEHLTLGSGGLQGKPGYIDVIGIGLP